MKESLFFKVVLVSIIAFFLCQNLVFSCDKHLDKSFVPRPDLISGEESNNKDMKNINLQKELQRKQEKLNRVSQQSKERHDSAQEKIRTIGD